MAGLKIYVDSSVVLRKLLRQPGAMRDWASWEWVVASELMPVEALRTLDCLRIAGTLSPSELEACFSELRVYTASIEEVPIYPSILRRACSPLPTPLRTLDAIHLATALTWMEYHSEDLVLFTHDRQLGMAARACGMDVKP
jgi:predicted nucleic acid-binding protein